ncbi:hypothetical protein FQA39_LY12710 [Lamprigera yunnana]|nr:hypothetical protein FQA39_LY12710 [Lamprigera yunnana]
MKYLNVILFIIECLLIISDTYGKCGELFLTVNAVTDVLEYNWNFTINCEEIPDSLSILHKSTNEVILETINVTGKTSGYETSNVVFRKQPLPGNWNFEDENRTLSNVCYPFLIRSELNNKTIDSNCIKIEPTWMQNFGELQIGNLMIPGTHDSGAWTSPYVIVPLLNKFLLTQKYDLWGQLVSGIRYFDIRVGVYNNENPKEWINHGAFKCTRMKAEFNKIAKFLNASEKEVVILHIKSFENPPNFTLNDHQTVLNLISDVFGDYILPRTYEYVHNLTLSDIWATNKRLIISYNNEDIVKANDFLWYDIVHKWADTTSVEYLYNYLNSVKNNHNHTKNPFCALMAELTPDENYIVNNLDKSLGYMANEVNHNLNVWLRKYNWSDVVNIVATDFFLGNDAISIAIEANERKKNYNKIIKYYLQ